MCTFCVRKWAHNDICTCRLGKKKSTVYAKRHTNNNVGRNKAWKVVNRQQVEEIHIRQRARCTHVICVPKLHVNRSLFCLKRAAAYKLCKSFRKKGLVADLKPLIVNNKCLLLRLTMYVGFCCSLERPFSFNIHISTLLLRLRMSSRVLEMVFLVYHFSYSFLTQYEPAIQRFRQLLLRNDNALNSTCDINIVDRNLAMRIGPKCFCIGLRYMMNVILYL